MGYSDDEWQSVIRLLLEAGFRIEAEDRTEGVITVRVPE